MRCASMRSSRTVPSGDSAAVPNSRTRALMRPEYSTAGVSPEVRVLIGKSCAVSVVDHCAGVQSPSAHTLAGVPTRHIHSART